MPYFLSSHILKIGELSSIADEEAAHILLSRRAKIGEKLKVQGPDGKRFLAEISEIKKHEVMVRPEREISVPAGPAINITLFQSVVASGTLDTILQKAVELGAVEIALFNSQYTATRLSSEKFKEKLPRFTKILWEAAKQSERAALPKLKHLDIKDVVEEAAKLDRLFVFDAGGQKPQIINSQIKTAGVVIGPEGGLSPEEARLLSNLPNAQLATLGPLLLKADTAAVAALAVCQSLVN